MSKPAPAKAASPAAAPAAAKASPAATASPGTVKKTGVHVSLKEEDDEASHSKVKKILTTRYNLDQLKKITEFDSWVDDELEKLCKGLTVAVELDFDEWDQCDPAKRKELLTSKLAAIKDSPARAKFIDEYNKRGLAIQSLVHDPSLKKTSSGSKLV